MRVFRHPQKTCLFSGYIYRTTAKLYLNIILYLSIKKPPKPPLERIFDKFSVYTSIAGTFARMTAITTAKHANAAPKPSQPFSMTPPTR